MFSLPALKNWILQNDFKYYLYSVLILVFVIFFLLVFLGITNSVLFDVIKQYFILNTSNLNTNIFFSSYTHTNPFHLIENVSSYIILFLLIFSLVDNKRKIKQIMLLALIVFPFVNSLFLSLITNIEAGAGLSGIIACLNGYLFVAISYNLKKNPSLQLKKYTIIMLIIFNFLVASGIILNNFYLIIVAVITILFAFYINRDLLLKAITNIKNSKKYSEQFLMITMWVFALLFVISTFRILAPVFGSHLNIEYTSHYLGLIYGLICSWLILR